MQLPIKSDFRLTENFISNYKSVKPKFGFNGLGEFVYLRTYSRIKEDGTNEQWYETVRRVVEGIYNIQKAHIEEYGLGWNNSKAQRSAQEMYDRIFNFKFLPAGRSLWAMGTPLIMEKGLAAALYNCAFLSTSEFSELPHKPFTIAMDMLMCGVGVGFDALGAGTVKVKPVKEKEFTFVIPDSREGWVKSLELLIMSFFGGDNYNFDYSLIRPAGTPIKTFGGVASGYEPLKELHDKVKVTLQNRVGESVTERDIVDIFNLIAKAVVAGNVRRSAEIALGNPTEDFLDLKDYSKNPDRADYGWASNNSIFAIEGMDYKDIAKRIWINGEPGICWIDNLRKYSRMGDETQKDLKVAGLNPCGEIGLESNELCNLVETYPMNHKDMNDYLHTLKYAYLYGKTVTLLNTHWTDTNRVMLRNRRIGISMTGLAQFITEKGLNELKEWMEEGYIRIQYYDKVYSDWFAIPQSIKTTTIKPSGTVSLLAGATPGIHFPESKFYIRRVRLAKNSPFVSSLVKAGYKVEPAFGQEDSTVVVEFPVSLGQEIRTLKEVSMWEQLSLAAFCQKYWADNSVSVTVTFNKEEGKDIEHALEVFQTQLKAVSFLPRLEYGAFPQMPYEEITEDVYNNLVSNLGSLDFSNLFSDSSGEQYCTNDNCAV